MSMTLSQPDLQSILSALSNLESESRFKAVPAALRKQAAKIRDDAKAKAPRGETGRLKNAIFVARQKKDEEPNEIKFGVGVRSGKSRTDARGAFYGLFIELGTVKQPRQSFLRNALRAGQGQFKDNFAVDLKARIQRMNAKGIR